MSFAPVSTLFDEISDFLVTGPGLEQIIAFQPSDMLNQRLHDLLDKNREDHLAPEEQTELDTFLQINHLFIILKAKARQKLASES